ncbi:peptide ABC transporter permease [Robertmurraya yapensis]|uniref:Peptide ABC transporter permease n=1 Tax=Bacillus yapensis TaxID=2492960 RepID=A0A431W8I7_9BACI|nr:peptide ABC transporter permease [Bacillus yapensis]RTR31822.1 peptide ABC transporter permease [Bacillus yapensis]TKS95835.1 peptide ABC transporter permease [Bacillus yapensis]
MKILVFIKKNPLFSLGTVMFFLLVFIALFGKYLPGIDTRLDEIIFLRDENNIPFAPPFGPNERFPIGTDRLGRDLLSLIVLGARETLIVIIAIALIRYLLAIPLGFFAHKNRFGVNILLNWINGFLSYIPTIIIVILLATLHPIVLSKIRPLYLILIIAALEVGRVAEMIKLELNQLSTKEFITGGNAVGISNFRLLKKYYMPFLYGKLLVNFVGDIGKVMFLLGQLGFLGIFISHSFMQTDAGVSGFENTSLSWPTLLTDAFRDLRGAIWIPFYASLAMTYVIFTFNILSQGIQKLLK